MKGCIYNPKNKTSQMITALNSKYEFSTAKHLRSLLFVILFIHTYYLANRTEALPKQFDPVVFIDLLQVIEFKLSQFLNALLETFDTL